MTSQIADLDRPRSFVDQQTTGPFARFRHVHQFGPTDGGGTIMVDEISFDAPLGPIGRVVDRLVLGRYMEQLIRERAQLLKAEAERRSPLA